MEPDESITSYTAFQVVWLLGLVISVLSFLMQITCFILIRKSRKTDEKILAQITFTRILVTVCEYYMLYIRRKTKLSNDIMFTLYFVSDFALICLMFVFSKNLYDNIVVVFPARKVNLISTTVTVWIISSTFGFLGTYILKYHTEFYFELYCKVIYALVKFFISIVNLFIYFRIFCIAFRRGSIIKTAIVAFLLVTTTCLQILITDLISYYRDIPRVIIKTFCVINSFHAVFITVIFIIILKKKLGDSVVKSVTLRLSEIII